VGNHAGVLQWNRGIATRHDELAQSVLSVVHAAARYGLQIVHVASLDGRLWTWSCGDVNLV
jgi:hypothetical protein